MKTILKKILDFLPFDGSKTKISLIIAVIGVLKILFPSAAGFLSAIIDFIGTDQGLVLAGAVGTVAGLGHKKLKEK